MGYEDLNDHDQLREDLLLAVLAEKEDPTGKDRARQRDQGKSLAGKSTLNRLELSGAEVEPEERYKKITLDLETNPARRDASLVATTPSTTTSPLRSNTQ
ncbi:MAG: hypothetical protein A3H27_17190 [Acidobacteria bacterium RIFCSPLOWO2_02_FULL_59_13]|nr:MAG: hypothetical protein A3H27_17190 [Acidobacteria bacterium RIFCSPLOWO2_02_FULL_59_13]